MVAHPPRPLSSGLGYFGTEPLQLCYVDESGKAETLTVADGDQQPVIVVAGVSIPEDQLTAVTHEWLELKRRYFPNIKAKGQRGWLDAILVEGKGTTVRRGYRSRATRRQRQHAHGIIDGVLRVLEKHDGRVLGRVWVKQLDAVNDEMAVHSSSLQFICAAFHSGLGDDERGMVVVDSQTHRHNHRLAHSVFTQRFGRHPTHRKLVDMPVFGHSDNHAGLQIADYVCSALLAPLAATVFAGGYGGWNRHCDSSFLDLRDDFGPRLQQLTYDFVSPRTGRTSSSLVVDDPVGKRPTRLLYGPDRGKAPS